MNEVILITTVYNRKSKRLMEASKRMTLTSGKERSDSDVYLKRKESDDVEQVLFEIDEEESILHI